MTVALMRWIMNMAVIMQIRPVRASMMMLEVRIVFEVIARSDWCLHFW